MTKESPIIIKNREELIFLLSEASQIEHMVMCQYLFAAFSLKQDMSEGLSASQLEAVRRWERSISAIAVQEMLHLAIASNLLISIGAVPLFYRPNFPQRAKYYPPGFKFVLLPFGEQGLQHFLFLERPEGMELKDALDFEMLEGPAASAAQVESTTVRDDEEIVPEAQEYATVGHLYRGIEQGFRYLVDKYGEKQVFIGPPEIQANQQDFGWPELIPVTDLASAIKVIETIVEEGEGARGNWQEAHYGKFFRLMKEYHELKQQDPNFDPSRPVLPAYVRTPGDVSESVTLITDPVTASIANLFNASYEVLLRLLIRFFVHSGETDDELQTLCDAAVNAMILVVKPLGSLITTLPIGSNAPGKTAGASFEIYRTSYLLPHHESAWLVLHERLLELVNHCEVIRSQSSTLYNDLVSIEENLRKLAAALGRHIKGSHSRVT